MEDILLPGFRLVYNGLTLSTVTQFTIANPDIEPSRYYKFKVQAKNCGRFSTGINSQITVASASFPSKILRAPRLVSFVSSSSMMISWLAPPFNGGFPILNYKLYVNNALLDPNVEATEKTYLLTSLTLGSSYKIQISSVNEIGESAKSESNTILFSNVPSAPASLTLASIVESKEEPHIRATWTVPASTNGDAIRGYRLYIDDGEGGDYTLVYDGATFPNVYTYTIKE